ncbi:MAG: response regulator transcription factor [Bacillota bacterium]|nr:response regulator transcription factor [Bacillota bacterium]
MYKILVIEDDEALRKLVCQYLDKYGYITVKATDFHNIDSYIEKTEADLVLLDINLPYFDGYFLCRLIRKKSKVPIIILSARNGEMDQVLALELGADDYLVKPFNFEIMHAKIKAALRRAHGEYSIKDDSSLSNNGLEINEQTFKISFGSKSADLSKNEFKLLKVLIQSKDKIVSRESILEALWDDSSFVDDNTLTVNVTRIKGKLQELGITNAIKTKRGAGYLFNSDFSEGEKND